MDAHGGITHAELLECLSYDSETGLLTRIQKYGKPRPVSSSRSNQGYIQIRVKGRTYRAHRLAWFYVHGKWPVDQIDHINGIRHDNRIVNLRECSNAENNQNKLCKIGGTGYRGISRHGKYGFQAQIVAHGVTHCLGTYPTAEEAHRAYLEAKKSLHDFQPTLRTGS